MCLGGVDGRQLSVLAILTMQQLPSWRVVGLEVCVAVMRAGQFPTTTAMVCALLRSITLSLSGRGQRRGVLGQRRAPCHVC